MEDILQIAVTVVCSVIASSGFWALISTKLNRKDASTDMLIGLGHDRIIFLGLKYIERGWITQEEYENLYEYLYKPYKKLGGNGSAQRVMEEVNRLPIHVSSYQKELISMKEDND